MPSVSPLPVEVVDLFCGIGGLSYGLSLAGLDVVSGYDLDKTCAYA
ncbi:MAG: DNA cytosine methyltransferase, partial [Porphyromonadaceae bacterium]|nr:DNA cytosine methyltransferase [Porphyromonadaceae bacterium]